MSNDQDMCSNPDISARPLLVDDNGGMGYGKARWCLWHSWSMWARHEVKLLQGGKEIGNETRQIRRCRRCGRFQLEGL